MEMGTPPQERPGKFTEGGEGPWRPCPSEGPVWERGVCSLANTQGCHSQWGSVRGQDRAQPACFWGTLQRGAHQRTQGGVTPGWWRV